MDNTLYDYSIYYSGVLKKIAEYLSNKYGMSFNELYTTGLQLFKEKTSRYPMLFNDLLDKFDIPQCEISACLEIFNNFSGRIEPYKDVLPTLSELKNRGYILGLITDGNPKRQDRKIKLLGLEDYFDVIVFTYNLNSPKPSSIPYKYALKKVMKKTMVYTYSVYYIGDDPRVDFKGAKEVGMKTIRILRGEFRNLQKNRYIDFEIGDMKSLLDIL